MKFPARLRLLREEKKMSQKVLSEELGVAQSTVGGWEASNSCLLDPNDNTKGA